VRGDLRHWLKMPNILSWMGTFLIRCVIKTIVDFTLMLHFRHPFDFGGIYWLGNAIGNQLFSFFSVYLYTRYAVNNSTAISLCNSTDTNTTNTGCDRDELPLWPMVIGLLVLSMLSFFIFSRLIKKEYLWTFFDIQTGKHFVVANFSEADNDEMRFDVFTHHRSFYEKIEVELKTWLKDNWERWEEDKPVWFNSAAIKSVPVDMLPLSALKSLGGVKGRRASLDRMSKTEEVEKVRRASAAQVVPSG